MKFDPDVFSEARDHHEKEVLIGELRKRLVDDAVRSTVSKALDDSYGAGVPGLIAQECSALRDLLLAKNRAYGNAALDPVRIFSKADPEEQLRVRIDDKLSRLARGSDAGEDVVLDLLGYLILLRIARRLNEGGSP